MKLENGEKMDRKCVLDWLNEVYVSPSLSYNKHTDEEIRMFAHDALVLLKKQDAVKPIITPLAENEDGEVVIVKRECGRCGYQFFTEKPNYCENCGVPILWEGR